MAKFMVLMDSKFTRDTQFLNLDEHPELMDEQGEIDWEEAAGLRRGLLDIEADLLINTLDAESTADAVEKTAKELEYSPRQLYAVQIAE